MSPGIGVMLIIPSIWGHWAGGKCSYYSRKKLIHRSVGPGQSTEDVKWIDEKLRWFLGRGQEYPYRMDEGPPPPYPHLGRHLPDKSAFHEAKRVGVGRRLLRLLCITRYL
jgi:hypothetical protein